MVQRGTENAGTPSGYETFREASAYCEAQEEYAALALPLPEVGSVWGVPGKLETRRLVKGSYPRGDGPTGIEFFDVDGKAIALLPEWHAWVRESGAVDLLADREALAAEVELEKCRRIYYQNIVYGVCNAIDSATGVRPGQGIVCGSQKEPNNNVTDAVKALVAKVKELEASVTHWRSEFDTAEAARMEAKDIASEAIRERDEFKRIGQQFERDLRMTFEQSCANLKRAEIAEASRDRLADRLRKIESLWCHHASHLAQDILTKEGLSS